VTACPRCGFADASRRLSICPRCALGGVFEAETTDWPDLTAAGLTIESELGEGGMGRVFRARNERLGRDVAVKVLRPESAADPDFRARFAREARTLARLEHPGIVAIHDFGTSAAGDGYLVMQLVTGGSLAERGPLPLADALAVARQLCDAVTYAHGRGVVHRDIKPENVLLGDDGRAKLTDFGIARLVEPPAGERALTRPSLVLGTPGYLAPEARAGAPADARGDVFALGALIFYMVTGRDPDGAALAGGALALPGEAAALGPVLARAMALDPARRTASAAALGVELAALAARPIAAAPTASEALPPEERTWRGAVALLAAVATAVAIYAALVSLTPRALPPDATLPFTAFDAQRLPDGRLLTRARFEIAPTLGAAVAIALALGAYGLLRRHWRIAGLDHPEPERPLAGARRVLTIGVVLFALFLLREALVRAGVGTVVIYVPVLGGVLELVMLYRFWDAVLEARRTARSLAREPLLWLGLALALFPPTYHLTLLARAVG
jgi:serine/threonine-protein kinase